MLGYHASLYIWGQLAFVGGAAALVCLMILRRWWEPARFWAASRWMTALMVLAGLNAILFGDLFGQVIGGPAILLVAAGTVVVQILAARRRKQARAIQEWLGRQS